MQQMVVTSFNAEGCRFEHQEELSKRWRVTTRSKTVGGRDSRRRSVVTSLVVYPVRIWCMQCGKRLQRVCYRAHRLPLLPVTQPSAVGWKKKRTNL